jgi:magnesium-transporting ATPase (P-type)
MLVGCYPLFHWEQQRGSGVAEARTVAVNLFVMVGLFYLFNCRSFTRSMFAIGLFSNPWVIFGSLAMVALQLAFTYHPAMNALFHSAPIGPDA